MAVALEHVHMCPKPYMLNDLDTKLSVFMALCAIQSEYHNVITGMHLVINNTGKMDMAEVHKAIQAETMLVL